MSKYDLHGRLRFQVRKKGGQKNLKARAPEGFGEKGPVNYADLFGKSRDLSPRPRKPAPRQPVGALPSKPSEFHTELLTEPDLILSHLPARAIAGDPIPHCIVRLLPFGWPNAISMTCSLRSTPITGASSL